MNIDFSFLTWTNVWFEHTGSVLFDQETAGLCDDGGARMCIDVTQISFAHHRWGRACTSANITSPADEASLAAFCSNLGLWNTVLMLTLVGGWFYCILEKNPLALRRNFTTRGEQVQVKHNFVWEFRVHYLVSSGFVCELFHEGNTRLRSWLPVQNCSVYC